MEESRNYLLEDGMRESNAAGCIERSREAGRRDPMTAKCKVKCNEDGADVTCSPPNRCSDGSACKSRASGGGSGRQIRLAGQWLTRGDLG